jgi:phospholipase/lecithinase/hemolysin
LENFMSCNWMRRALLVLMSATALLVAACGSGTIESQLSPSRLVVFGDAIADLGQRGSRYTVNDGSNNIWTQQVAASFGLSLTTAAAGGTSYATGNARVVAKPDAAGNGTTPTVKEQIDTFLAAGAIGGNDLVVISAGTADVIAEMGRVTSGAQTSAQMLANVQQAGRDLAGQVRRLVQAGGTHVVVVGPYHLGITPWARGIGQEGSLTEASRSFNDELLIAIVDLGASVLYVDAPLFYNLMGSGSSSYSIDNVIDPVCTSVDPGPGIGTGAGQLNSALCTPATIAPGADYGRFMFADRVYPTPQAHVKFADYAYSRIRDRW